MLQLLNRTCSNTDNLLPSFTLYFVQNAQISFSFNNFGRHSKFHGYRVSHDNLKITQKKMRRTFTREYINEFGNDQLGSAKLLLAKSSCPLQKLTDIKRNQLALLYLRTLTDLMAEDGALRNILITEIKVPEMLNNIKVYWRCTGSVQRDQEIEELLNDHEGILRRKLSESCYSTSIPQLIFVRDRKHLLDQEMNKLFEMADYGVNYRTLISKQANVLGSVKNSEGLRPVGSDEPGAPKEASPPRWMENWRKWAKMAEK